MRTLPWISTDGFTQLAIDDLLLLRAADDGEASVRFYGWSEPTLSLGYFQPATDRLHTPSLSQLTWVRRATGGAAIVHHFPHEITYSLALPVGSPWHDGQSWLCKMHHLIEEVLFKNYQIDARAVLCGEEQKLGPVLCFLHQTPGDLVFKGSKIVGSAQRKLRGALLQHGTILLSQSAAAPELPGIAELHASEPIAPQRITSELLDAIAKEWNWNMTEVPLSETELEVVRTIRGEKYASDAWNLKR